MSHSVLQMLVLFGAGAIAIAIGGFILIDPVAFHANAGIEVGNQIALRNELRAAGGALLAVGLLSMGATVIARLRSIALTTCALIYGAYGATRVLSFLVDGVPNFTLVWIAVIELAVAAACAVLVIRNSRVQAEATT